MKWASRMYENTFVLFQATALVVILQQPQKLMLSIGPTMPLSPGKSIEEGIALGIQVTMECSWSEGMGSQIWLRIVYQTPCRLRRERSGL